ncbi:longitudinals lacking protein, isoforms A/B/D/L isoform X10 [Phymastichus coffea]|uniref:longitudinals lacking protein, isoforms A/B/D/L isoform X10 n=1 Tax=Phymastichus coffea TaxID=108790 RepID=UPI00273CE95A|nr:longitudinals lacking protein, isoforms A/B/D/L isoform X10 [Phymastichus coffea]
MEDDQQFCLRWNNHQSTLIQNFDTLLESGTLVDCTLAAEGKYLKAHKVVLSACSPYFEGLLSEHYDKHPVFILKDVKFKELKAMMDYMYRGEVNISQDQLTALLKAAESLQIKGLSDSKTGGSTSTTGKSSSDSAPTRQTKSTAGQAAATAAPVDIPHTSSGLTIEKNKVPRQSLQQAPVCDLPEDSASPQCKGLSSREGSTSPTRKRKRQRRRSLGNDDNSMENHEASNSSDANLSVPPVGVAAVAEDKTHADQAVPVGRSALMQQLTKPADEMIQIPMEKPEPNEEIIQPKSEYLDDQESVEDLTHLDDDMNDMEMDQDSRPGPSTQDGSQHPGMAHWHMAGDRSNTSVGAAAGAPGVNDEVFLAAQEAAQAQRDSQGYFASVNWRDSSSPSPSSSQRHSSRNSTEVPAPLAPQRRARMHCPTRHPGRANINNNNNNNNNRTPSHHSESVIIGSGLDRRHNCTRCGKSYKNAYILKRHLLYECGKAPSFSCPHCAFSSKYERNLKAHINHRHVEQNARA